MSRVCINAWIIHRSMFSTNAQALQCLEYLVDVCKYLLAQTRVQNTNNSDDEQFHTVPKWKRVSAVDIPLALRYEKYGHWSVYVEMNNSQRCKYELCKSGW